jgi:hypothetical protein
MSMANKRRDDSLNNKLIHVRDDLYKIPYRRKNGLPSNKYFIKTICSNCGGEYFQDRSNFYKAKASLCSRQCRKEWVSNLEGIKKYKRGDRKGPILVKVSNHPNADRQGYVPEHRLVMEKFLGRILTKQEIVHHINMNQQDNNIENLCLFNTNTDHFLCHGSLNKCVEVLINNGDLWFDKRVGRYSIKKWDVMRDKALPEELKRKKDNGRADALLIAEWARRQGDR